METVTESKPESSPGRTPPADSGLQDYLALTRKGNADGAVETEQVTNGAESTPAEEKTESQENEVQQRSQRDKSRNARRHARQQAELRETRESLANLQAEIAELKNGGKGQPQPQKTPTREEGKPIFQTFLDNKEAKYKTWDEAHEAFLDARDAWKAGKIEVEIAAEDAVSEIRESASSFGQRNQEFMKTAKVDGDAFQDAMQSCIEALDDTTKKIKDPVSGKMVNAPTPITDAIVNHPQSAELIYFLGTHEDVLEKLADMPHRQGIVELGRILGMIDAKKEKTSDSTPKTEKVLPRAPSSVGARGVVPNREQALERAADPKNDNGFAEFQRLSNNPKTKERLARAR